MSEERRSPSKKTMAVVGLVLSASLLAWVFYRVDPSRVWGAVTEASLPWVFAAVAIKLCAIAVKGIRWRSVLAATLQTEPRAIVRSVYAGYAGNAILPMKLGELVKIQLVRGHNQGSEFGQLAGTILLERTLDALVLALIFAPVPLLIPLPDWATSGARLMSLAFALGAIALWWISARSVRIPAKLAAWSIGAKVQSLLDSFSRGLAVAREARTLFVAGALTFVVWAAEIAGSWCLLHAFVPGETPLGAAVVLTTIVALGVAIPSAPGAVGTHQALYIVLLGIFGIAANQATAMSVTISVTMMLSLTTIGLGVMWLEGISIAKLRAHAAQSEDA